MKTLYLDIFSGISGDMFIGALLDVGVDFQQLEHELRKLNLGGLTALFGMLSSCSSGLTVVNIDNGFGAGYAASQMNALAAETGVSDCEKPGRNRRTSNVQRPTFNVESSHSITR